MALGDSESVDHSPFNLVLGTPHPESEFVICCTCGFCLFLVMVIAAIVTYARRRRAKQLSDARRLAEIESEVNRWVHGEGILRFDPSNRSNGYSKRKKQSSPLLAPQNPIDRRTHDIAMLLCSDSDDSDDGSDDLENSCAAQVPPPPSGLWAGLCDTLERNTNCDSDSCQSGAQTVLNVMSNKVSVRLEFGADGRVYAGSKASSDSSDVLEDSDTEHRQQDLTIDNIAFGKWQYCCEDDTNQMCDKRRIVDLRVAFAVKLADIKSTQSQHCGDKAKPKLNLSLPAGWMWDLDDAPDIGSADSRDKYVIYRGRVNMRAGTANDIDDDNRGIREERNHLTYANGTTKSQSDSSTPHDVFRELCQISHSSLDLRQGLSGEWTKLNWRDKTQEEIKLDSFADSETLKLKPPSLGFNIRPKSEQTLLDWRVRFELQHASITRTYRSFYSPHMSIKQNALRSNLKKVHSGVSLISTACTETRSTPGLASAAQSQDSGTSNSSSIF